MLLNCWKECSLLKKNRVVINDPILNGVVVCVVVTIVAVVAEGGMVRVAVLVESLSGVVKVVVVVVGFFVGNVVAISDVVLELVVLVFAFDVGVVV